ncbi:hypothetical protein AGR4B_Lc60582 [Agrobacterium tumefaciens str. CFBP 5621]|nr:hypothetical protein AGR4B_Lc60582 [Agrobacterium tumefaciens str. CFBP 5621]
MGSVNDRHCVWITRSNPLRRLAVRHIYCPFEMPPDGGGEIRILGGCLIKNLRIRSNCNVSVREETHANACYFCGFSGQRHDSGGYCRGHRS